MRVTLLSLFAASCLFGAAVETVEAQCPPPTFRGPEGPRPTGVPAPGAGDTGTPTPGGDTGNPTPGNDPVTPGPNADPKRGPTTPRGGIPLPLTRGKSAKKRFEIQWQWPKPTGADRESVRDYESVLHEIRGDDPRPLLILREGSSYGAGYDRLLQKKFKNERIALLSRWFHCVRFSQAIMQDSHPWRALFSGKYPPQCFVVSWDGHQNENLSGIFSLGRIQRSMKRVLGLEYKKNVDGALRSWVRILDKLDTLDAQEGKIREQIESLVIERGAKAPQVRRLERKLAGFEKTRRSIRKKEVAVLDLQLRRGSKAAKSALLEKLRGTQN